jgi:hypothetical protein
MTFYCGPFAEVRGIKVGELECNPENGICDRCLASYEPCTTTQVCCGGRCRFIGGRTGSCCGEPGAPCDEDEDCCGFVCGVNGEAVCA